jgi:REP-associated tyrosine transposase
LRLSDKAVTRSFYRYSRGDGFRLVHFSVQSNHLHLIAEADSKPALSRAMQKLGISLARRLDTLWKGVGRIYEERYHQHILTKPLEVRNALLCVVNNAKHHGAVPPKPIDLFSSAPFFDGYAGIEPRPQPPNLIVTATNWLLTHGWRRRGRIKIDELPRG